MSGAGPPHQPHSRHVTPNSNITWNPLQVPNYFARQPQIAHIHPDPTILPSWHTPTTEASVKIPHKHVLNDMLKTESLISRDCVDLSLSRNGSHNGNLPTTPISLSVRDTNKINSLPASILEFQSVEMTKCPSPGIRCAVSPGAVGATALTTGLKSNSPGLINSGLKSLSPNRSSISPVQKSVSPVLNVNTYTGLLTTAIPSNFADNSKTMKRSNVRVDSFLEKLSPISEKVAAPNQEIRNEQLPNTTSLPKEKCQSEKSLPQYQGVLQTSNTYDENSNSSGINLPTSSSVKEDDSGSMHSNEDSLDSTKSRRKRKPSKTIRLNVEDEAKSSDKINSETFNEQSNQPFSEKSNTPPIENIQNDTSTIADILEDGNKQKSATTRGATSIQAAAVATHHKSSSDDNDDGGGGGGGGGDGVPEKIRRKVSSESETIDNIAAMVQEGLKNHEVVKPPEECSKNDHNLRTSESVDTVDGLISERKEETMVNRTGNTDFAQALLNRSILEKAELSNSKNTVNLNKESQKESPLHKKPADFVDIENKLEEMFAGIVEKPANNVSASNRINTNNNEENSFKSIKIPMPSTSTSAEPVAGPSELNLPNSSKGEKKSIHSKRNRTSDGSKTKKIHSSNPKIEKKTNKSLNEIKDVYAYDSGSNSGSSKSRGPFVHIRGSKDYPVSVNIVNTAHVLEDDVEKKLTKTKRFHDDSEYRHKVHSKGLHCSTLSNKYDAERKDASWICAFCKRGPHATELTGPRSTGEIPAAGDLFGPYFITTQCVEFERRLDDPHDRQFKSRKISRVLDETSPNKSKKIKRKSESIAQPDVNLGITETDKNTYEVWVHEDCLVWSQGVYLVGPKIAGLEEAVWSCCSLPCLVCNLKGANIACLKRGCLNVTHLCCAQLTGWHLDGNNFKAYCPSHLPPPR